MSRKLRRQGINVKSSSQIKAEQIKSIKDWLFVLEGRQVDVVYKIGHLTALKVSNKSSLVTPSGASAGTNEVDLQKHIAYLYGVNNRVAAEINAYAKMLDTLEGRATQGTVESPLPSEEAE